MGREPVQGAGLGLRRVLLDPLIEHDPPNIDFYEVAPENWMRVGGRLGRQFRGLTETRPFTCHGLCLSLGGPAPLDVAFLKALKLFLDQHEMRSYSEHLSYCGDEGHLYDLMPIPFTAEAVVYVAERIRRVQDILEQRIAVENISYYAAPGREMEELDFLLAVLAEADCDLLLDVNNVYVNSVNHGYPAGRFIECLPAERVVGLHVAGHYVEAEDFLIDTHGAPVIDPVWRLLDQAYTRLGPLPTLLERDFNVPPLKELLVEIDAIRRLQQTHMPSSLEHG